MNPSHADEKPEAPGQTVVVADVKRALDLGAGDYLAKPFNPQELIARVSRFG